MIGNLVFAVDRDRLIVADCCHLKFCFPGGCSLMVNITDERRFFFQWLRLFLDDLGWLVLVGDWNVILDPKINRVG